ncbi:MAG: thiamine pyrophosphate-dependent enzyme [Candidatus Kapabacteria bacterium]|nr:thiamine pyrophosphate-dependent enzyme [Candidatus Kapabacteria bacterium]
MPKAVKSKISGETSKNGVNPKPKIVQIDYMGHDIAVELYSSFDFSGFDKKTIIEWYKLNHLGRRLDDKAALYLKMAKGWSYHASFAGHDGIQLALGKIFRQKKDFLFPYYRDMMTSLAAGITVEEIILNGLSKDTDVAGGGRHMSNHFAKPSINIQNVSSCTGNHSLHAAGVARAITRYNDDAVSFYSGGDSACSEGYFYEAINISTLEKLPVIYVIQNNKYGISVPLIDQTANQVVSDNFRGFKNLKIFEVDGRDPFDSYRKLKLAVEYAQSGSGPAMVHADCDRIGSHSNSDRQELYRTKDEMETQKRRDPLMQFRWHILDKKILSESEIREIEENNKELIFEAADLAEAAPEANGKSWTEFIIPEPFVKQDDNTEFELPAESEQIHFIEAINSTLKEEFRSNPDTYLWGQDIGKGGVFNVVKGMPQEFGKLRVFNAPIAEDSIVGSANGFSRYNDKIRLVVEGAEFADYFWPAMEQLIECSHDYWRTKGQFSPNVVIRLASGGYIQGGLYHSQNLEAVFATIPGIRIVIPAFADDAAGLLRNSIRSRGTTLFLEPKYLYNFKYASGPKTPENYIIPFGKARVRRPGKDITVVSYGTAVHLSMMAAEELAREGISVEVIDLRSIAPWDKQTVFESVKKTNRVVIAHEDRITGGFGGEVASTITEELFRELDAPVLRVGSKNVHVGFAKSYESEILLNKGDVVETIRQVLKF